MEFDFAEIDAFFQDLGTAWAGVLAPDHAVVKAFGGRGWKVSTLGVVLIVHVDDSFPFSRPTAYIENYDPRFPRPHVEPKARTSSYGRFCLRNGAMPTSPLSAVRSTLIEARNLLKAHEDGTEENDFAEDFLGYWNNYPTSTGVNARTFHITKEIQAAPYVRFNDTYFAFQDRGELDAWWNNRFRDRARSVRQSVAVALDGIPGPDRFPDDVDGFVGFHAELSRLGA